MGQGKTRTGSATRRAATKGASPLDDVMRVDKKGRNIYYNDYLHRSFYVPESKVRTLSFFETRTVFCISLAAIIGATSQLWIGIATFVGTYVLSSVYFYMSFLRSLEQAPEPELTENEQVLEAARRSRKNRQRIGYAVIGFAVAAIDVYYLFDKSFEGPNLWASWILAAGAVAYGIFQLASYLRRR